MTINAQRPRDQRRWIGQIVITLDGRDVTGHTYYVDPRRGIVRMFLVDRGGAFVIHPSGDHVVRYERRGRVAVSRR